jgi:DNA-binding protein HU-beta
VLKKADLIDHVAERTGMKKRQATEVVDAVLGGIKETLSEGGRVQLAGFGTFEVRDRKARMGVNPVTKAPIHIQATRVPAFKAGKALRDVCRGAPGPEVE